MSAWILLLLLWLAPPERYAALPAYPGWAETVEQRTERYRAIATDIAAVVSDPQERPAVGGQVGRARSAALLVAVAFLESGFAPDADKGPCWRGLDGRGPRCDGGLAVSAWQIRIGAGKTPEGWNREDLFADRRKAVRVALHLVRRSVNACRKLAPAYWLSAYTSGSCARGHEASAARVKLAQRLLAALPPPKEVE